MLLTLKLSKYTIAFISALILLSVTALAGHEPHQMAQATIADSELDCQQVDIRCAKTMTSAFAPNGDLWRLWSQHQQMYYQISLDRGETFSATKRIAISKEKISARNENRPKLAFDNKQGVYLSWAMPREKKYTADIRFSYSKDYGKTFSAPITVNDDGLLTGHSFNEMLLDKQGNISIVWLDGRLKKSKSKGQGSAIYMAKLNVDKEPVLSANKMVINGTCVCCRLALAHNNKGNLAILWRHIYGDNIREFALTTLNEQTTPYQVSYDHWQINGCPHQGGALAIDRSNRYHLTWYNQGDKGKGVFYAFSDDAGKSLSTPIAIGEQAAQAGHPHLSEHNGIIDIVWTQFTGVKHQLWQQRSIDNGKTFSKAKVIASANNGADRPFIIHYQNKSYVSWQRFKQGHWLSQI